MNMKKKNIFTQLEKLWNKVWVTSQDDAILIHVRNFDASSSQPEQLNKIIDTIPKNNQNRT